MPRLLVAFRFAGLDDAQYCDFVQRFDLCL
jgi:hypothetical protein